LTVKIDFTSSAICGLFSQFLSLVGGIRRPNIPRPDRSAADYPNDADMARTAVITSFVKELLQNGSSLQLQMESNKSRTGKSSTELYGSTLDYFGFSPTCLVKILMRLIC